MSKWVSVKTSLPDHCEVVLVFHGLSRTVAQYVIRSSGDAWHDTSTGLDVKPSVSHWMRLPEPPDVETSPYEMIHD